MKITSVIKTVAAVVVSDKTITSTSAKPSIISMLGTTIPVFLIFNIPTIIFLAIYFACREKLKLPNELDKINVQDLEQRLKDKFMDSIANYLVEYLSFNSGKLILSNRNTSMLLQMEEYNGK